VETSGHRGFDSFCFVVLKSNSVKEKKEPYIFTWDQECETENMLLKMMPRSRLLAVLTGKANCAGAVLGGS